jgi:DNA-binding CsgD family transcriptional regulator
MHARRILVTALTAALALVLLAPQPAHAQADFSLDRLTISIWPEFDRTAALVFYTGMVGPDVPLPAEITLPLPPAASLHAVAYIDGGSLVYAPGYTVEGSLLTLTSPNGSFHVEFYDPALAIEGDGREYELGVTFPYAVANLYWEVQQPAETTAIAILPAPTGLTTDSLGLPLHVIDAGGLQAGEEARVQIAYTRPTTALTADLLQSEPLPTPVEAQPGGLPAWAIAVVIAAALVLAAAIIVVLVPRRRAAPEEAPSGETAAASAAAPADLAGDSPLTEREMEVLALLAEGMTNPEIGARLHISPKTAARHRENIMSKLGLHNRTELVKYAIQIGLVKLEGVANIAEEDEG